MLPPRTPRCLSAYIWSATLGAAILAMLAAPAAHGQPFEGDTEPFKVNKLTDGFQELPDVARTSPTSTDFVVVWESEAEFSEAIFGRIFDATGNPITDDFPVSLADTTQTEAAVAQWAGGFVAVWQTLNEDDLLGQLFDAAGNRVGEQKVVNFFREGRQEFPAIASDAEGNFVVAFQSSKFDGDGDGIVMRLFSSSGAPQTSDRLVNLVIDDDQEKPAVARQAQGEFLVAWESEDSQFTGIFARAFDATGEGKCVDFQVNTVSDDEQKNPDVGAWPGGFVVVWESPDEESRGIWARRFDSNCNPLDAIQFPVNNIQDGDQSFPAVDVFDGGEFVVTWEDFDLGVYFREFDANGMPVGDQVQVDLNDRREQGPRIALRDQGFMLTWFGASAEEPDDDIWGRTYSVPEAGATALGLAALLTLAALARNRGSRWPRPEGTGARSPWRETSSPRNP